MRLPLVLALGLTMTALSAPPRAAHALPTGPLAAPALAGEASASLAEAVRGGYRSYYRSNFRGGWSRRYGTIRRYPRHPRWLR